MYQECVFQTFLLKKNSTFLFKKNVKAVGVDHIMTFVPQLTQSNVWRKRCGDFLQEFDPLHRLWILMDVVLITWLCLSHKLPISVTCRAPHCWFIKVLFIVHVIHACSQYIWNAIAIMSTCEQSAALKSSNRRRKQHGVACRALQLMLNACYPCQHVCFIDFVISTWDHSLFNFDRREGRRFHFLSTDRLTHTGEALKPRPEEQSTYICNFIFCNIIGLCRMHTAMGLVYLMTVVASVFLVSTSGFDVELSC